MRLNTALAKALQDRGDVVIASVGYRAIIGPLLRSMGLAEVPLVACRILPFSDRLTDKLQLVESVLGRNTIEQAMTITDSRQDARLLDASAAGQLVQWPQARYQAALSRVYLPFTYLSRVKRPGENYLWHGIIKVDLAFWLIASLPLAMNPAWHVIGVILLITSFWAVYETGYVDNDRIAKQFESDPQLSDQFFEHTVATPPLSPWIWAGVLGFLGLVALNAGALPSAETIAAWTATLVATWLTFYLFNRVDKTSRTYLYPLLQLFRVGAIMAVVPIVPVAIGGLCGAAVAAWVGYVVYRHQADNVWPRLYPGLFRLLATALFSAVLLVALEFTMTNLLVAGLFIFWTAFNGIAKLAWKQFAVPNIPRHS
ncbi:MAG: hypothetical protein JXQ99_11000 [Hyphomicrobiaceae bacterium]